MVEKDKKLIYVAHPLRQLIWMHMARYCCLSDGRQYVHLLSGINLLRRIVGEVELKKHLKDNYKNINNKLSEFEKTATHITAFCSIVYQKDYRHTSFYNEKFRLYYNTLSEIPLIHQEILDIFVFLLNKTTLINTSIPSAYFVQASKDLIFKTEDEEKREQKFLTKSEKEFKRELEGGDFGEENED